MAKFRRGTEAAAAPRASGKGGRFVRDIYWDKDEKKYIQFIPPTQEWPQKDEETGDDVRLSLDHTMAALTHEFIITGTRDNGNPQYSNFVSRKDPNIDGVDGYDPIWDRFGVAPKERTYAVFMELEPTFKTEKGRKKLVSVTPKMRKYVNRDGEEVEVPVIGVARQSWWNFFEPLETIQEDRDFDLETTVFAVVKSGDRKNTSFQWLDQNVEPVDINEYKDYWIDLEAHLEELASLDRVRELIDPLPDEWKISRYAGEAKSNAGRGKSEDTEATAPWAEDEPEVEDEFEKLKSQVGAK